jgi:hypothetical protein
MKSLDEEIAAYLQQALAANELARAPSFGKPMPDDTAWNETPEALRMPFKILKDAGVPPPEIELFHQRAALRAQIAAAADPNERDALLKRLSELEQVIALRLEALARYARP